MIGGIVCPMMSPIQDDGCVDHAAVAALVHHLLAGQVDALLVAGTTGEFACLDDAAWCGLVEASLTEIDGAVPAIVNVSHCSLRVAVERAQIAVQHGASYVASTPPYYVPLGDDEMVTFYHRLADASGVPLFLYNIPQFTQSSLTTVLPRLAQHPNVIGIKESSGLYEGIAAIPRRVGRPFVRLAGTDVLLPTAVAQGLDGVVPGLANVVPRLFQLWWRALRQGDAAVAQGYEEGIRRFTDLYERIPGTAPYMQVFRYGLRMLGIEPGTPSGMESPLADPLQRRLQEAITLAAQLVAPTGLDDA
jgi:4-hydroxy-tetrahydrodipicolinate synthase